MPFLSLPLLPRRSQRAAAARRCPPEKTAAAPRAPATSMHVPRTTSTCGPASCQRAQSRDDACTRHIRLLPGAGTRISAGQEASGAGSFPAAPQCAECDVRNVHDVRDVRRAVRARLSPVASRPVGRELRAWRGPTRAYPCTGPPALDATYMHPRHAPLCRCAGCWDAGTARARRRRTPPRTTVRTHDMYDMHAHALRPRCTRHLSCQGSPGTHTYDDDALCAVRCGWLAARPVRAALETLRTPPSPGPRPGVHERFSHVRALSRAGALGCVHGKGHVVHVAHRIWARRTTGTTNEQ